MFFGGGDPFEHFHNGGGGAGGSARRSGSAPPDTTKLYQVLGIPKTATAKEIKTAYRKLAVLHHPDKGGDDHVIQEINGAYEILSDVDSRAKYDQYGLEGLSENGGNNNNNANDDLFCMFFGGRGGRANSSSTAARRKGPDVNHPLSVSLEDLYNGKTVQLAIHRQVLVQDPPPKLCTTCDGQGVVLELRQIALGMVQQLQRNCSDCRGEGYVCQRIKERKVLQVHIDKGMRHNQKISFRNMADEAPNMEAGTIHFVVQEKEHEVFKRKAADLLITKTCSLNEALCGFEWKLTHLDKRQVIIQSRPGEIIHAEDTGGKPFVKIIKNEGMPSLGNPFIKGDLYVLFTVEFPKDGELNDATIQILKKTLPNPAMEVDYDKETAEICHLELGNVKNFGKGGSTLNDSAYDSDGEDAGAGQQPVQCQQIGRASCRERV